MKRALLTVVLAVVGCSPPEPKTAREQAAYDCETDAITTYHFNRDYVEANKQYQECLRRIR